MPRHIIRFVVFLVLLAALGPVPPAGAAEVGEVRSYQKISDLEGGFGRVLDDEDYFAVPVPIGDLDDDGVEDLAVGAVRDDDGGADRGAVWILFMRDDGRVRRRQKISATDGGFTGALADGSAFGAAVAGLDDLDGDGIEDIAVGAPVPFASCSCDTGNAVGEGAVWILFLNRDGTVKSQVEIGAGKGGGLEGELDPCDRFGLSIAALGDLDVDNTTDIAVGANSDDSLFCDTGAVYVLFLNPAGGVKGFQKISNLDGGFGGELAEDDTFGTGVAFLGALEDGGPPALAVGAPQEDSGGTGEVWILFLNPNGTVMPDPAPLAPGTLDDGDVFGFHVARLGDLDGDGIGDVAVSAIGDDDGGMSQEADRGAVWILFLNGNGTLKSQVKISDDPKGSFRAAGGFLDDGDSFGFRMAGLGDVDVGGPVTLAVGALTDDGGPDRSDRGAVWVLDVNAEGSVDAQHRISDTEGDFGEVLDEGDAFITVASIGDLDGDGIGDLAVGAFYDDDGGMDAGAVWVLFMRSDDTVRSRQKISATDGGFAGTLGDEDHFGYSIAALGDLDGDGVVDLAVGADENRNEDKGGVPGTGALWILFLDHDGTVKAHVKIGDGLGGFPAGELEPKDTFGSSVAMIGDVNLDGIVDLAVGAQDDDDPFQDPYDAGAVWILFLNANGTVKETHKISQGRPGFTGPLEEADLFGSSVTGLGDIDGDDVPDLAVGAFGCGKSARPGAVWIVLLNADGTVKSDHRLAFDKLDGGDCFGASVAAIGDLDRDGIVDLAVGADRDDDGGATQDANRGAVWILFLDEKGMVRSHRKISDTQGRFLGGLEDGDNFGFRIANLGDRDGDGNIDLAVGAARVSEESPLEGGVWLLFLSGDIVFGPPEETLTAGEATIEAKGDFDGDGLDDVAVVIPGKDPGMVGHVEILRNLGNGGGEWLGFDETPLALVPVGRAPSGITAGDFDDQPGLDFAVSNAGDNNVFVLLNDGTGTAYARIEIEVGVEPSAVTSAFLDGDGIIDLAVANRVEETVYVLAGDGFGGFKRVETIMTTRPPETIDPADLDNDKDLDLLFASRQEEGTVGIALREGGEFLPPIFLPVGAEPVDVVLARLDADDLCDVVTANFGDATLSVIINRGGGMFDPAFSLAVGAEPSSVDAADLDLDGDVDLVVVATDPELGRSVQVLENLAALQGTTFDVPVSYGVDAEPNFVVSAMLNGDPFPDLVTANTDDGKTGGSVSVLLANAVSGPVAGDANGDGCVGFADVLLVLANWGVCPPVDCMGDVTFDGIVGFADVLLILANWGLCG